MAVFCWGSTPYGELGLGGIEDELVLMPRKLPFQEALQLKQASCGATHTLLLLNDGRVFSCGNNDHGQIGHGSSRKRPQFISALENYPIQQVATGNAHSLALNDWGQVFSWGSSSSGQLGYETDVNQINPKIIRTLATKHVVQIASGHYHCLALTNSGDLYAWGANAYGQCGLGTTTEKVNTPTLVQSLKGIPIAFITCGGNHSFAVSKSGAVFGFGKNVFGQLGVNDNVSKAYPTQLKSLRSLGVRYIACGDDFSVFLTQDGGVFTCGLGTFGQLGHGSRNNEIIPRMVIELMGSTVTQIACGKRHTIALISSRRIYSFGIGGSGQLGNRLTTNVSVPQVILGPWTTSVNTVQPSEISKMLEYAYKNTVTDKSQAFKELTDNLIVKHIFSGGDRCFVLTVELEKNEKPNDFRIYDSQSQICVLSRDLSEKLKDTAVDSCVDLELLSMIEVIFKSQACLNGSFLLPNDAHICCTSKHHGVDVASAQEIFENIQKVENETIKGTIWESITTDLLISISTSPPDVESLRIFLTLPLYHEFINCRHYMKLHIPFSLCSLGLSKIPLKIVATWWSMQNRDYYERFVENYKNVVMYILNNQFRRSVPRANEPGKYLIAHEKELENAFDMIAFLYSINHKMRHDKVPYEIFHLPELHESVDIRHEYVLWAMDRDSNSFHLCNYPFIFDAPAKTLLLQTDQAIQKHHAMQNAAQEGIYSLFRGIPTNLASVQQYVTLTVTRENIVYDTLRELQAYADSDLKKPLKVSFHGEEAEDAGGVTKEFFLLLLRETISEKYGMFKYYEDSRYIWFSEVSFEEEHMYTLLGTICGLAIYNFTIIHLPFPLALYKKLLKEKVDLSDLQTLSPVLGNSLQSILDYEGDDLTEVFSLTFEVTREIFGDIRTDELKPGGKSILVSQENKQEFVDLYIDFVLNKSVERHFQKFYEGFMKVCGGRVLELFKPHELMEVVIGNEDYDWDAFESEAEYKNGYISGDITIRLFWEVFHELSLEDKKKFLLFLTGSDRIPITGMKAIKILIQPINDDKCLPVAHTCFNLLDLPRYKTKERLKYKLLQAIQQTEGFSLV